MIEVIASEWVDTGNGECSAIVTEPAQPRNYKAVRVFPTGVCTYGIEINGRRCGDRTTKRVAMVDAIGIAKAQFQHS